MGPHNCAASWWVCGSLWFAPPIPGPQPRGPAPSRYCTPASPRRGWPRPLGGGAAEAPRAPADRGSAPPAPWFPPQFEPAGGRVGGKPGGGATLPKQRRHLGGQTQRTLSPHRPSRAPPQPRRDDRPETLSTPYFTVTRVCVSFDPSALVARPGWLEKPVFYCIHEAFDSVRATDIGALQRTPRRWLALPEPARPGPPDRPAAQRPLFWPLRVGNWS